MCIGLTSKLYLLFSQMEKAENKDPENEKATCEFQKIHAKVRAKMEVQ